VAERRDRLADGAVEVERAAGDGVGIAAGRERSGDSYRTARGQRAVAGVAAGEVVVVERRDGLGAGAVEAHRAAGDRVDVAARGERARDRDRAGRGQRAAAAAGAA